MHQLLTNQESRKQALQLTISKMGSAFERARLCNDVPCMKQIKEMRPVLSKAVTTSMFSNFLYCSLSLSAEIFIGTRTDIIIYIYIYLIDFDRISPVPIALMPFFSYPTARWSDLPPLQSVLFLKFAFPIKAFPPNKRCDSY